MDDADKLPIELVSFDEYMSNPEKYKKDCDGYWTQRGKWIMDELKKRNWLWIVICGGEIVAGSSTLSDFPDEIDQACYGIVYDRIPFTFSADTPVE